MPKLDLFLSQPHDCGYRLEQRASTLFVDPMAPMDDTLYAFLLAQGFRRSGRHVYCHHCAECQACLAVRLPVAAFAWRRSLRRVWRRNQDLTIQVLPATFTQERFDLYHRYIQHRHGDGPMKNPHPEAFSEYLFSPWSTTRCVEFRQGSRLLMVAVLDYLPEAASAVYTFFDPTETARSLGTYAILWQVQEATKWEKQHLYLGYWIDNCQKMHYKSRFRPLETYQARTWRPLETTGDVTLATTEDAIVKRTPS